MERLTTNKKASEMGMYELAHNGCYIGENGSARYRDFSSDVDCREMIKMIMANFGVEEPDYWDDVSDEVFDDEMMENLMYGTNDMQGLIALFYRNMWAMADLREKLKYYEDLEEQGRLIKLPCKIGDTVYVVGTRCLAGEEPKKGCGCIDCDECIYNKTYKIFERIADERFLMRLFYELNELFILNKTVFLTKEEAEKALERHGV